MSNGASPADEQTNAPRVDIGRLRNQVIAILLLTTAFFWRVLFVSSQKIIAGYDILVYHYYARAFTREALLGGGLPKWNPYEYAGMPFAADPGNCVFYPLNKFFLFMPISSAIGLNMALHVFLAGLGMLMFARCVGVRRGGALVAAVSFMFGGYFIDRVSAGHEIIVMCSAYLPWIFFCYEKASRSGRVGWLILGGVFTGLQILTGASQPVLYTGLFVLVYAVAKNLQGDPGARLKPLARDFGYLAAIGLVGLGLSAIQLIPTVELVLRSVREETSIAFVGSYSFPPKNFIHFLFPYLNMGDAIGNWEFTCYLGILPLALGLATLFSVKNRVVRSLAAVGFVALLIMLGRYTPLFPVLLRIIPGLKLFRIHARAELGLIMVLAALAGIGWEEIFLGASEQSRKIRNRLAIACGGFAAVALGVAALFLAGRLALSFEVPAPSATFGFLTNQGGPITSLWHPRIFLPLAAVFMTLAAAIHLFRKLDRGIEYLLLIFIVADLFLLNMGRIRMIETTYLTQEDKLIRSLKNDKSEKYFRVWLPLDVFFGSRAKFFGIFDVNGHNALGLGIFEDYVASISGVSPVRTPPYYEMDSRVFEQWDVMAYNLLNVRYYAATPEDGETGFYWTDSLIPRALFVSDYVVAPPKEALMIDADPLSTVVLYEEPPPGFDPGSPKPEMKGRVKIDSYRNDEIQLTVDAPVNGFVVLSEVFYPGWKAEVDGRPVDVLRGNFLLRVVPVPKGARNVRVFFAPRSLLVGKLISAIAVVFAAGALLFLRIRFGRGFLLAPAAEPENQIEGGGPDTQD